MAVECGICGEKIRLIQSPNGRTLVCDYKPVRFTPAGGPHRFIMSDGRIAYGKVQNNGSEKGFFRHIHSKDENG